MRERWHRRAAVSIVLGVIVASTSAAAMARGNHAQPASAQRAHTIISTKRVRIVDFNFAPRSITVVRGTRVRWLNTGAVGHTSTSNNGAWDSGIIAAGGSFSRVFRTRGTFSYHCNVHPTMHGTIRVT